jgi:predicted NBD/HSP70 family sugar kinase
MSIEREARYASNDSEPDGSAAAVPKQLDALVAVLDSVREGRARTRPELIAHTGLSRAVVTQRVAELCSLGLLEEAELGASTGGRAPRLLRFRSEIGHVLVAHLGVTRRTVALADLTGDILVAHEEAGEIADGPEAVLERVDELGRELRGRLGAAAGPLWGIALSVPEPVEPATGRAVMPGWDEYPVRDVLSERYGVPVCVDHDLNAVALGELKAGAARDQEIVIVVKVGAGIGAAIIVEGKVLRGVHGYAGSIGHIQVTDDPSIVCLCGRTGCLEYVAGGLAIARGGHAAAADGRSRILADVLKRNGRIEAGDVVVAADLGDPVARDLITAAARVIAGVLASLVNFVNPSLIVIAGVLGRSGDGFLATIRETLYGRSPAVLTRDLVIQRSALEDSAPVVGLASLIVGELFGTDTMADWLPHGRPGDSMSAPLAGAR